LTPQHSFNLSERAAIDADSFAMSVPQCRVSWVRVRPVFYLLYSVAKTTDRIRDAVQGLSTHVSRGCAVSGSLWKRGANWRNYGFATFGQLLEANQTRLSELLSVNLTCISRLHNSLRYTFMKIEHGSGIRREGSNRRVISLSHRRRHFGAENIVTSKFQNFTHSSVRLRYALPPLRLLSKKFCPRLDPGSSKLFFGSVFVPAPFRAKAFLA
jgi:hypothetical protein